MKILAVDSSGLVASIALVEDDQMIAEYTVNYKKTHSQTLVPMLDEIKKMIDLDLASLDAIAVVKGPGSFTGLRIGSATVKGLGLALNKPIISVPTVDALSYNVCDTNKLVCPIMDARREQVYTGLYRFENGEHIVVKEQCAIAVDELCDIINDMGEEVLFLGDGVPVYKEHIDTALKVAHSYAPAHMARQRAGALAELAKKYYVQGIMESAAAHRPDYLRLSQAERERLEAEREAEKQK